MATAAAMMTMSEAMGDKSALEDKESSTLANSFGLRWWWQHQ
jgi:hypothetical protein